MNLDPVADSVGNARQHGDRRRRPVELTPAMIGYDERVGAGVGGQFGVLDVEDALDDQGPPQRCLIQATSSHDNMGSNCSAVQAESDDRSPTPLACPTILRKVRRLVRAIARHQRGRIAMSNMFFRVSFGGADKPLRTSLWRCPRNLEIGGEHESRAAGRLGAIDQIADEILVAHDVKLEPERPLRHRGDVLDRANAHCG